MHDGILRKSNARTFSITALGRHKIARALLWQLHAGSCSQLASVFVNMSQSSSLDESDLQQLEEEAIPDSTKRATQYGMRRFQEWLERRNRVCDFATVPEAELNETLRRFYAEVRSSTKQGSSLAPATLNGIRAAIHRFVTLKNEVHFMGQCA